MPVQTVSLLTPIPTQASRQRVWVLDDDPCVAEVLHDMLALKYQVEALTRSEEVFARLEQGQRFDALVCDLLMPGSGGAHVYRWIRNRFPGLESRIVFMTGSTDSSEAREFFESVPNARLEKPFGAKVLRDSVAVVLARELTAQVAPITIWSHETHCSGR